MKFKVGDVCILLRADWFSIEHGRNCPGPFSRGDDVIILEVNPEKDPHHPYKVAEGPAEEWWVREDCLRLKPPPVECKDIGSWDLCPWRPKEITVD